MSFPTVTGDVRLIFLLRRLRWVPRTSILCINGFWVVMFLQSILKVKLCEDILAYVSGSTGFAPTVRQLP